MNPERKKWIGRLVVVAKVAVATILCWFIYRAFVSGNETLSAHTWHVEPLWLAVSGALYLLGLLPQAIFWQRVAVRAGQPVELGEGIRAFYISQLGKYVPGKWMVILLRRAMVRRAAVENTVVAASIFYDTFTSMAVGAAISALLLVVWYPEQWLLAAAALGAVALLGVPTVPRCFRWLLHRLGVDKLNPTVGEKFNHLGARLIVVGWISITCGWLVQGMSLWATLRAMGAVDGGPWVDLSLHTVAVALGVVAGFVSQIPGGLVMREWISGELLEPRYGPSVALVSTIVYRLVLLSSELVISILLYASAWRPARREAAPVEGRLCSAKR
jgi:uncharacterized membrane protein YbhN (UPF0104 family)